MGAEPQHPLFRPEVVEARRQRIEGEVALVQPVRMTAFALLLFLVIVLLAVWIAGGGYARTEIARGLLVTAQPSAKVVAIRPGQVAELLVSEGQEVRAGQRLVVIRVEQPTQSGGSSVAEELGSLENQRRIAEQQLALVSQRGAAERSRLTSIRTGLVQQQADLRRQIELQREVVASSGDLFERIERLVERGYVSRVEVERRRQAWLAARGELARLEQQANAAAAEERRVSADEARADLDSSREAGAVRTSMETLRQQGAQLQQERAYTIVSPVAGRVAAIQTAAGRTVDPSVPLMEVVPDGSALRAQVYAPTRAIGFVKPGQEVRLLYDAYPYQRFGSFGGRITGVSRVVIDPRQLDAPLKLEEPVYRIEVEPDAQHVVAFGERLPLQPGMTLTANIVLERRSFLDWLLAPLRAVLRRDG